ncbi:uvrD/REP helicase N-terminal domain protein [Mycobacterium xenopi 4042]|uniref:UvrD/REP helicase N-terminal domain protein n=1 Tax=Mycobacterium xenopi 4042 TaxID=1299334 RepID=X7YJM2_MYCXE|nr:uvrD/REP helicase N-terminal domain protein [Mycobacterium xenopi 4042]
MVVIAGPGRQNRDDGRRVVWLVANGYAAPDQVLGLTFTRKAAGQLLRRVRSRLAACRPGCDRRDRARRRADGQHLPRLRRRGAARAWSVAAGRTRHPVAG